MSKSKKLMYIGGGLLLVVLVWFAWKKYGTSTTPSGIITYSESDILRKVNDIKGDAAWYASVKSKATTNGKSEADQLRADAIYMLEVVQGKTRA